MCNDPGTPAAFQEGGEVFGTVAGTPVSVGTPGQYQPGIHGPCLWLDAGEVRPSRAAGGRSYA
jgi:hypothetical protein